MKHVYKEGTDPEVSLEFFYNLIGSSKRERSYQKDIEVINTYCRKHKLHILNEDKINKYPVGLLIDLLTTPIDGFLLRRVEEAIFFVKKLGSAAASKLIEDITNGIKTNPEMSHVILQLVDDGLSVRLLNREDSFVISYKEDSCDISEWNMIHNVLNDSEIHITLIKTRELINRLRTEQVLKNTSEIATTLDNLLSNTEQQIKKGVTRFIFDNNGILNVIFTYKEAAFSNGIVEMGNLSLLSLLKRYNISCINTKI